MKEIFKKISDQAECLYPAYIDSDVTLTMASSDKYVIFLNVLLTSIVRNKKEKGKYDIVILSDGITMVHRNRLLGEFNNEDVCIRFIDVSHWMDDFQFYTALHITKTTYLRLIIADLFKNFEKVIYLDCDTIVNFDIAQLYRINISKYMLAAVTDSVMNGWCHMEDDNSKQQYLHIRNELGIKDSENYFNAGVLMFNIKEFKRRGWSSNKLLNLAGSHDWIWFDQDVLNLVCKDHIKFIDPKWNVMVHVYGDEKNISEFYLPCEEKNIYFENVRNPYIVHFAGNVIPVYEHKVVCRKLFWKYARMSREYYKLRLYSLINIIKKLFTRLKQIMKGAR